MEDAVTVGDVRSAAVRIAGAISVTPCRDAPRLTDAVGVDIRLKLEQLQFTGSFKERGALNALLQLTGEQKARGVIAASAGNHAQGLAYHARRLDVVATVVMPRTTPHVKIRRTREFGATVVLEGASYSEAALHAQTLAIVGGATMIHPYDDPAVIAGGGTVALEMLRQCPEIDTLVVPVGGGGLLSGMACAARALRPNVRIVGVRAKPAPRGSSPIADGIAVDHLGAYAAAMLANDVDDWITIDDAAVEAAMHRLMDTEKIVTEGAGAAALAGIMQHPERFRGRCVGVVVSGGNVDPNTFGAVVGRVERDPDRSVSVRAYVMDAPGALVRVASAVAQQAAHALDTARRGAFAAATNAGAELDVTLEIRWPTC